MRVVDRISSTPIPVQKSTRAREVRAKTSARAGKIIPLYAMALLREDSIASSDLLVNFDMAETVHPLDNAVGVRVQAHFVPFTAFARFPGIDGFNKSYMGKKDRDADAAPIPFFNTVVFDKTQAFWKTLGIHWPQSTAVNDCYLEAYNVLVNWLRSMRAKNLGARLMNDTSLAQAFWNTPFLYHIKPDFDAAMMDGEVSLTLSGSAPVSGIGFGGVPQAPALGTPIRGVDAARDFNADGNDAVTNLTGSNPGVVVRGSGTSMGVARPLVFAELAGIFGKVSIQNFELAKQVKAFANLREQYKGRSDDNLVDLLMQGIRVPDEDLRQPILIDSQNTIFGYTERHAMDGANLDQSVTVGRTQVRLKLRTPPMNTGGVLIVTAQIVPEQLFERLADPILGITHPADLPDFQSDFLDPQPVEVVQNKFVDVLHATPSGTFGYAPLNHAWRGSDVRIGGKFYRPVPDTFVEDRQRFWSVETPNPALNSSFYLVPADLPHSVFADTVSDPFEITTLGNINVVGNTVFGPVFEENMGSFGVVMADVDQTRLVP